MSTVAQTESRPPPAEGPETCTEKRLRILSAVMRQGLCLKKLPLQEVLLAHQLVLDTYDRQRLVGDVDFERWARELGFGDAKGLRWDKCRNVFESLVKLRLVLWNRVGAEGSGPHGTYELLPDPRGWDTIRRGHHSSDADLSTSELPFCVSREIDEALSSVSRNNAVLGGPSSDHLPRAREESQGRPASWEESLARLKASLNEPTGVGTIGQDSIEASNGAQSAKSADAVGGISRKASAEYSAERKGPQVGASAEYSAETKPSQFQALATSAEYSAEKGEGGRGELASLALVPRASLVKASAEYSAERSRAEEAWEFLCKVDRKLGERTLEGRFRADYDLLCQKHHGWVLSYAKNAFEDHERRFGRGPARIADPVGWIGRVAASKGLMVWHSTRKS